MRYPLGTAHPRHYVSVVVEQGKRVVVFEGAQTPLGQ
jgi:hypothetical protein